MTRIIIEVEDVQVCSGCKAVLEEGDIEPVYECGDCGEEFTKDDSPNGNNQCPQCNKFAARKEDDGKSSCCGDDVVGAFQAENDEGDTLILDGDCEVVPEPKAPEVDPAVAAMNKRGRSL